MGFNDPLLVQFGTYVSRALGGDLGTSFRSQRPVLDEIFERLPSTLELAGGAMLVALTVGIPVGVAAAAARRRWWGDAVMSVSVIGLSIPAFWLGVLGIILFGVNLRWVSVTGGDGLQDLILPSLCLGLGEAAVLARLAYSSVKETLITDYVRVANAKGLTPRLVLWRHALRNALIPVVTVFGIQLGNVLGGSVFIEAVFARSGLGRYAVNAITNRDFPQIQGMVLFAAVVYVLVNLMIDIAYTVVDPRLR
jgi:peptide/nickel transport system permease protein